MSIIQQPDSTISLSGNMNKFIVSSGSPISFILKDGDTVLLDASYKPGVDGRVTIDVKDIIESRFSFLLATNNVYQQTNIAKTFTAIIDGTTVMFKVIRAGVANLADTPSNWLNGNFLTWQPTEKQVTYYSPEWLTYYATESCTLKLNAHFPDGANRVISLGSMSAGAAYTANLQYAVVAGLLGQTYPSYYDVYVENTSNEQLTYIQRYLYSLPKSELEQWFLFENSLGGIDTMRAYGDTDFEADHAHNISIIDDVLSEYRVDTKKSYNKNTGYLDEYERRWLLDFFPSKRKFIHSAGAIRAVVVVESDVKYTASELPSSYNFKYRFADEYAALLNLIRNEDAIPVNIVIPDITSPDFILPPRLSEYPRVTLSEGVILPAFDPHSETPKTTTVGAILAAAIAETLSKIQNGEGGGELVNLIRENDISSGSDNTVFSSLRTLFEISEAIQNINLDDKYLRKDIDNAADGLITFLQGLVSNEKVDLLKGFKTAEFGVEESGDARLNNIDVNKITSSECAELLKGFRTDSWGLDDTGQFRARKIVGPEAVFGDVTLQNGMRSTTFIPGMFGEGFFFGRTEEGKTYIECDDAYFRDTMTVDELIIHKISHTGGAFLFSPAGGEVMGVQNMGSYWKLELKDKDNIFFKQYDQVICQNFSENKKKRYWRLCTSVDVENGFIHLSKTDCEALSADPEVGDEIITLGNRNNPKRRNAIYISSYGEFGPYQQFLRGVDSYDLTGRIDIQLDDVETLFTVDTLEIRGKDGKKTRVPRERGKFKRGETYYYYDRVNYNGAIWTCMMLQTTAAPDEKQPQWVKETDIKVGGTNLLREYAIQFGFKYWGELTAQEGVNFIDVNLEDIASVKTNYLNVAPSNIQWTFPDHEGVISVRSNVEWNVR